MFYFDIQIKQKSFSHKFCELVKHPGTVLFCLIIHYSNFSHTLLISFVKIKGSFTMYISFEYDIIITKKAFSFYRLLACLLLNGKESSKRASTSDCQESSIGNGRKALLWNHPHLWSSWESKRQQKKLRNQLLEWSSVGYFHIFMALRSALLSCCSFYFRPILCIMFWCWS